MDLLGGYGSDADVSGSETEGPKANGIPTQPPADIRGDAEGADGIRLLADLPAPKKRRRRAVKLPIPVPLASDSEDDEDRPKKKVKASTKGMKLSDVLPPPSQAAQTGSAGLLGSGFAQSKEGGMILEVSDDEANAPEPFDGKNGVVLGEGNEAYRVFDEVEEEEEEDRGAGIVRDPSLGSFRDGLSNGPSDLAPPALGDQMLQQALQAEAQRTGKADPFAGLQLKEVRQEKLTYQPPEQREAQNAARTAFGADYEARIRSEAGPQPQKTARRKHQIQSLYHQAKMKELEMMEQRGQGVKTRRETQAKYGWS